MSKLEQLKNSANQVVVIKFGGRAIDSEETLNALIEDTIAMTAAGIRVVLVHGGGTAVNDALASIGKKTVKVSGLRVTDSETLKIAVDVFSKIGAHLVKKLEESGAKAVHLCSPSTIPFKAQKMHVFDSFGVEVDLGWVGDIIDVEAGAIQRLMGDGSVPVISPIGIGREELEQFYNINADHAALALATKLQADSLVFMTDVPGLLMDISDFASRVGHLTPSEATPLIENGTISGGMLPKIKSCIAGVQSGIERILILNSFDARALLEGFLKPEARGTLITRGNNES